MATLSDLIGFENPDDTDGISFLPTLLGNESQQKQHEFLFWEYPEYGGQVAIRMGDYKVVRQHLKDKKEPTLELYNLKEDPSESNNIAEDHAEIIEKAAEIFKREHEDAATDRFRIPLVEEGLLKAGP
jgi:arylsulfatase